MKLLQIFEKSLVLAAGAGNNETRIILPTGCCYVCWFARHLNAAPVRHMASPLVTAKTADGTFNTSWGLGHANLYFDISSTAAGTSALGISEQAGKHHGVNILSWQCQPNATTDTKFYARFLFYG